MPDYSHVSRDAGAEATVPDFSEIVRRGARQRRRRRAAYVGVAALALSGALGLSALVGGEDPPQPTPTPRMDGLVFTRDDGSTFRADDFTVSCVPDENDPETMLVRASTTLLGPGRSGHVEVSAPIDLVADGGTFALPSRDAVGDAQPRLFAVDPLDRNELTTNNERSRGRLSVTAARCGADPALSFTISGVLDSELGDMPTVRVSGGVVAPTAPRTPVAGTAAEIVADPRSRMETFAVSSDDPDVRAAVWQGCSSDQRCERKYAVAVTDDGFRHRTVLPTIYREAPMVHAGERSFLVRTGLGTGIRVDVDGATTDLRVDEGAALPDKGPVVNLGSGQGVWVVADLDGGVVVPIPGSADLFQVVRLGDGSLASLSQAEGTSGLGDAVLQRSTDGGQTWSRLPLDLGENALPSIIPSDGSVLAVDQGGDGATLSPLTAIHRFLAGETEPVVFDSSGPTAFTAGMVVLPDGRLLVAVEEWSGGDEDPGLFAAPADDWSSLTRVPRGAPFDDIAELDGGFLTTTVTADRVSVYVAAPPGGDHAAYRSDDGGGTWEPVALR
ncbi:sialidase family protein [Nocardioides cavernaquae]|uniref:Exo-alpha-sialidase n=1 Tax=Nocardioides cavernaquae TaxID=2321396 RepID=A0A3A5H9R6_9ACTN|nr:sialidase family protein [Nocardioides cavernaquae]RJS46598.1 exo-alpha-sialidase [Nocardioides cavernaquae]